MDRKVFEKLLDEAVQILTKKARRSRANHQSAAFERQVRETLNGLIREHGLSVDLEPTIQSFPDIVVNGFGIEVKVTSGDSWRTVANSINEGTRIADIEDIYIIYGKMGGTPEVRWGRYEDSVMHVRTSHSLRFEVQIGATEPLFKKFGVTYNVFRGLSSDDKMKHIRAYVRGRLKKGERLWWLGDEATPEHSLPPQVRLFMNLSQEEKRRLRAEAALLCPSVVKPSRAKHKYDDVALYLLTYHGVLTLQARDLFSAGSVALRSDSTRGGNYLLRSLQDIEEEMLDAARYLPDSLFREYWDAKRVPSDRIKDWLKRADALAKGWKPSKSLFRGRKG